MSDVITRAVPDDLDTLLPLIREFYEVDKHPFDVDTVLGGLLPLLADDTYGQVWLIRAGDGHDVVGYVVVTWSWSLESGGRDCILDEIFVRTPGHGLGGAALRAVLAAAATAGARAMFLETEAHNDRARTFYLRAGFEREDSVWMTRQLG